MAHMPSHENRQSDPTEEQFKIAYPNQYSLPPVATGDMHIPQNDEYYFPVNGHDGTDPASMVVQLGHHPSQPSQMRTPWWIWGIAIADIIIAIGMAARVGYSVVTYDVFIEDRDTLMWVFFLMFLSLAVQFLMGVALILGLLSSDESTTLWYLQGYLCGAYFLTGETGVVLLGSILKLESGGDDVGYKVVLVLGKTIFRVISIVLVRRFLADSRKRSLYRVQEAEQHQNQMVMQHLQSIRHDQEQQHQQHQQRIQEELHRQQQLQLQQQQHQLQEQQLQQTPPSSANANAGSGEVYYYMPQMSYMMTMMMNNSSST